MTTPQDKIFEALEEIDDEQLANWLRAEITMLKNDLAQAEDRLSKMREKFDEMAIKLYGGRRN